MINLAHNLKIKVTVEGVEEAEQAAILRKLACNEFQGFYCFDTPWSCHGHKAMGYPKGGSAALPFDRQREFTSRAAKIINENTPWSCPVSCANFYEEEQNCIKEQGSDRAS
jgi:EAL domain-containing protein (putative c-di-GMP-specific phosphodiesterase class I)